MQSKKRRGCTIDIITPHIYGDIKFHVKRYANGHLAYDMERHGKMAYHRACFSGIISSTRYRHTPGR